MSTQFASSNGQLAPIPKTEEATQLAQERRAEVANAPKLEKFLNRTLDAIASLEQNENLKLHNEQIRCVAYYDGRIDGFVRNGEWVDNPKVEGEILGRDNDYKKQIDKLLMEMARGRIEQEVTAISKFNSVKREAAQFAQSRVEVNQDRIETEAFLQAENMSLVLKAIAFRYSFFDLSASSQEKSVELNVVRNMIGQGKEITVCRTCGMTVDKTPEIPDKAEENPDYVANEVAAKNCPHCGDTETKSIAVGPSEGLKVEQQKKSAGRVVSVRPDATMVQLDLNARDIPSSSFIRWKLVMRRCDWEAMYPNTRIPSSNESTEAKYKAEAQNQPSNSSWSVSSDNPGGDQFEKIEGELVWLDTKVYQRYRNKENEQLKGGSVLRAGVVLTEQFPDGVCVARIGQTILDLYPQNKNKCWTMCVYGLREHALHGSGTTALLGPQEVLVELNSAIQANIVYNAGGRDLVRSGAIEGDQLPAINQVAYVNDAPPEVTDIASWAMGKIQPEGLSTEVYAYRENMQASMQDAAGTSSLSMQGAADAKVLGTATGVEASRDQAVGRMIPNRRLQAAAQSDWSRIVLELERENYSPEVFLDSAGKGDEKGEVEYTERGVRAFFEMDVATELSVKPRDGSWVPTTPAQEKANASEFGMIASKVQDQDILSLLAPKYGIDYAANEWGAAQRSAGMRLEEYARVTKIVSNGNDVATPEMVQAILANIALWAQVTPLMDKNDAFRNYYRDWWASDEGRNASPLLRMVIQAVFELHGKATAQQGQEVAKIKLDAQAPERRLADQQAAEAQQQAAAADEQGKKEAVIQALGQHMMEKDKSQHDAQMEIAKTAAASQMAPQPAAPA